MTEDGQRGRQRRAGRRGSKWAGGRWGPLERPEGEKEGGLPLGCGGDRGVSWAAGSFVPEGGPGSRGVQEGGRFRSSSVVLTVWGRRAGLWSSRWWLLPAAWGKVCVVLGSRAPVVRWGGGSGRGKSRRFSLRHPHDRAAGSEPGRASPASPGPAAAASLGVTRGSTQALLRPSAKALLPAHLLGSGPGALPPRPASCSSFCKFP